MYLLATCQCFSFSKNWVDSNWFSPNLVCALILWRSGLGLLKGKFCHFFSELSSCDMIMERYYQFIEDIYSFAVNTINIVVEWNENISIFTSVKHEWKFECFHYTRWKFLWYSLKKSKFSFFFIVHTSMRVSDVISNVTKQNMNVMASTHSA